MIRQERAVAFGPGRVNIIGEHTDYNAGLALTFAIAQGVTVTATRIRGGSVRAHAIDLDQQDTFALRAPERADGWRAFVRGAVAELRAADFELPAVELEITGTVPEGSGLSSSAALEVALCLALIAVTGEQPPDAVALARLCSSVENIWVGANTGLLDQLAGLCSEDGHALLIDFKTLDLRPVPLPLAGSSFVVVDSGESHSLAASGYNERRHECERACEVLGVATLRDATRADLTLLPELLGRRARHVLDENDRVLRTVEALRDGDLARVGECLDASHRSLHEFYDSSTSAVEAAVERLRRAGAVGARMVGGGFGGHVLALFPPDAKPPADARLVEPGPGGHLL